MKKLLIGLVVITALVGALLTAGFVYAQNNVFPGRAGSGWGMGWMNMGHHGWGGRGGGMMTGAGMMGGQYGPMHGNMVAAVSERLGISAEDLNAALADGKTMWQVAEEQGFTAAEITNLMQEAHTVALEQAVASGILTAEQAEWMNGHMLQMQAGRGNYGGHCFGNNQN
jgi:hypothetical protein